MPSLQQQLKELAKKLKHDIEEVMDTKVAQAVIKIGEQKVQEVVYDAYKSASTNPKKYERTGLLKEEWLISPAEDGVCVSPGRYDGYTYVAEIVEFGHKDSVQDGYQYPYFPKGSYGDFRQPRPFVNETRKEIVRSGVHKKALKKGLEDKGYKIE